MLSSYDRSKLENDMSYTAQLVMGQSKGKTGLEWNQFIGRIIINDFIKQLADYDGTDFAEYMNVLPYIEYGLFQSAISLIQNIEIDGLDDLKKWLIQSLSEAEDRTFN